MERFKQMSVLFLLYVLLGALVLSSCTNNPSGTDETISLLSSSTSSSSMHSANQSSSESSSSSDSILAESSSSFDLSASSSSGDLSTIPWNASVQYGRLIDQRDLKEYKTIQIGDQNWMAENLDYEIQNGISSWRYEGPDYSTYGRLYTQDAALIACPSGWLLPDSSDWRILANFVSAEKGSISSVAELLKATAGWTMGANGVDAFGFRALPGGDFFIDEFSGYSQKGVWWTSDKNIPISISTNGALNFNTIANRLNGYSIRCIEQ